MDPSKVCDLFEDAVQISQEDITFALNPGEVDEPEEANQVLLGKIISRHRFGKSAIQGSLKLSWNAIKGWKWKDIGDGIIQFTFSRREDALNVLARRPWFICGALIVIMPWPAWLSPAEVRFDKTPIWVHIESIPPFYWNLSNLKELASKASPVFELPPGVEDAVDSCGNFYPMFGIWLKSDAPEKSTFTTPLAKWFQDWVLQKRLFQDPTLRNQMKVHKAIRNGEEAEIRECRRQYPGKKRIVSDEEEAAGGDAQSELVITQLPLVYLPGIGEIAPFGNNSKTVSIQDLQDAAEHYAATQAKRRVPCNGEEGSTSKHATTEAMGTNGIITSLEDTNSTNFGSDQNLNPFENPSEMTTTDSEKQGTMTNQSTLKHGPCDPCDQATTTFLGSQAQLLQWPSNECWAQPKARELLMGALTVDKFHREPVLFNPIINIDDFRVEEHLHGPRKRKAADGHLFRPNTKPILSPSPSNPDHHVTGSVHDPPKQSQSHDDGFSRGKHSTAEDLLQQQEVQSFSPGSNGDSTATAKKGRRKGKSPIASIDDGVRKRRGRPPKSKTPLGATPKSFKGGGFSIWGYGDLPGKVSNVAMRILAWNCRGLGNSATVRQLAHLVRHHKPEMMILSETRLPPAKFNKLCAKLHFPNLHYVPPIGRSGGLAVCWMKGVACNIQSSSKFLIMCEITSDPLGIPWMLLGTYGPPSREDKEHFWVTAGDIVLKSQTPLIMLGDMNGTLNDKECFNYHGNTSKYAFDFRRMVHRAGLIDLGFLGPNFTWAKGGGGAMKRARLDRGLATTDWRIQFPNAIINHLAAAESDHRPLLLDTLGGATCKGRQFKYENMWARDPRSFWVVKEAWKARRHENPMINFHLKVKATSRKLGHWNKTQFTHLSRQIQLAKTNLAETEQKNPDNGDGIEKARKELAEALLREEIHWKQKSRVQWLQEGDMCSKFFMASTIVRRRRNYIQHVKLSPDDEWIRDNDQIAQCFLNKFKEIFKQSGHGLIPLQEGTFQPIITEQDNLVLNAIPQGDEVRAAICDMGKDKAPGPYGLPPSFYLHHWDTVNQDLVEMVVHFFTHLELPNFINDTSFVLVPKKESPSLVNDYRPIALCNVAYKIISKIIALRLRDFLPKLISPNQAAFVKGRLIGENTMIAREIVHSMNTRKGKRGYMLIKLDLEKAYDKLDWNFIIMVLNQLGFSSPLTDWIKRCISATEIKLLLNGVVVGNFNPERGLRQGDPMSPALYILAAETLSRLLVEKEGRGLLKGFKLRRRGGSVTHLMFADDIVLFGEASIREARSYLDCLNNYCNYSGQAINFSKSSVYFSKGVSGRKAQEIAQTLGMRKMNKKATYLGLPLFRSTKRTEDTKFLIERVLKRIQGWKVRLLSTAGKTCLIKSVGSSLSNYVASSDVIPLRTANKIDKLLRDFWWGDTEAKRKLHLVAWDRLCKPKSVGGLGFRTTEIMNKAFLMKWAWKILSGEESLWSSIINDKYIKHQSFLDMEAKPSDSILWKAILRMRPDLQRGICRKIGDGNSTSIWFDPWVPGDNRQPIPCVDDAAGISMVSNFISNQQWNVNLIRRCFREEDAKRILNITLPESCLKDSWIWLPNPNGEYSIKSAYRLLKNVNSSMEGDMKWKAIWGAKIHNRLKMFWWPILANCMPTKVQLSAFIPIPDTLCSFCSNAEENSFHLFWECNYARALWFGCYWNLRVSATRITNWEDWLKWFSTAHNRPPNLDFHQFLGGAAIVFESIWRERNGRWHEGKATPVAITMNCINSRIREFTALEPSSNPLQSAWQPPPPGWVACNSDASIGKDQSTGAVVFRDDKGTILKILSCRINHCDLLPAEIYAVCAGVAAAKELGFKNIVFQCDSLNAVAALNCASLEVCNLHYNIQELVLRFSELATSLNLWEIIWTPRSCNRVAHLVAQWANRNNKLGVIDLASFDDSLQLVIADGHVVD
uniref:Reverse transcriptase domain-containing protein n=1 Tax=Cannabis sativa TaxID=3483 RepID=A0A803Q978_CANSA